MSAIQNTATTAAAASFVASQIGNSIAGSFGMGYAKLVVGQAAWAAAVGALGEKIANGTAAEGDYANVIQKTGDLMLGLGLTMAQVNPWVRGAFTIASGGLFIYNNWDKISGMYGYATYLVSPEANEKATPNSPWHPYLPHNPGAGRYLELQLGNGQTLRIDDTAGKIIETTTANGHALTSTIYDPSTGDASPQYSRPSHSLRPGDTLDSLALRFGASVEALLQYNPHLADPAAILPGATLYLTDEVIERGLDGGGDYGVIDGYDIQGGEDGNASLFNAVQNGPQISLSAEGYGSVLTRTDNTNVLRVEYQPGKVIQTVYDAHGFAHVAVFGDVLPPHLLPSPLIRSSYSFYFGTEGPVDFSPSSAYGFDRVPEPAVSLDSTAELMGTESALFIHPAGTPDNEEAGWDVNSPEFFRVGDGLLVRDLNGTGAIDAGRELFANPSFMALVTGQQPTDSLSFLHELDSHQDGIIDASDTDFSQLRVWTDLNEDGFSQAEELMALDSGWACTLAGTIPYDGDLHIETAFTSRLSTSQGGIAPPDEAGRMENSATGAINTAINPVTEAALSAQLSQWVSAMASFNPPGAGTPLSLGYVIDNQAPTLAAAWQ